MTDFVYMMSCTEFKHSKRAAQEKSNGDDRSLVEMLKRIVKATPEKRKKIKSQKMNDPSALACLQNLESLQGPPPE